MASFDAALDPPDTEAIRAFLIARAHELLAAEQGAAEQQAQPAIDPPIADTAAQEAESEDN
jgi:hypothetical protein